MSACYHLILANEELDESRSLARRDTIYTYGRTFSLDGTQALVRGLWSDHETAPGECLGEITEEGNAPPAVISLMASEAWAVVIEPEPEDEPEEEGGGE